MHNVANNLNDSRPVRMSWWLGYIVAIAAVALATLGLRLLYPYFPLGHYPLLYVIVVMAIAYVFGFGPAILAVLLGFFAYDYYFIPPLHTIWPIADTLKGWAAQSEFFLGMVIVGIAMVLIRRSQNESIRLVEDLRDTNRRVTNILESITDAFFTLDRDWRFTYANPEAERLSGRSSEELVGKSIWELFPGAVGSAFYQKHLEAMSEHRAEAFQTISPFADRWVDVRVYPSVDGLAVYQHDINERRETEQMRALLSAIVESSDDAVFSKTLDGIILTWNSGAERIYGYTPEEAVGRSVRMLAPPDWPDDVAGILERIKRGEGVDHYEAVRMTKDGRRIYVSLTVSPIRDSGGNVVAASTIARDITQRKQAEEALVRSEEKHRSLFETMAQGTIYYDSEGRISSVNPAAQEILGRSAEELVNKSIVEIGLDVIRIDGSILPVEELPSRIAFSTGSEVRNAILGVYNPKDQDYRWLNASAIPQFRPSELKPYQVYATFADATEPVRLRQAIEHDYVLLQRTLFPGKAEIGEGYDAAAEYVPAYEGQEIGGDFYDVFQTSREGQLAVLIGDVSGKGIEAAALAAATRSTVRALAYEATRAGRALTRANAVLYEQQPDIGAFVTAFLAIIDLPTGYISYAGAGHPPALLRRAGGEVKFLSHGHPPIGIVAHQEYDDLEECIGTGDKMILYTDGITEARRGIEMFGEDGIRECVSKHGALSCNELAARILEAARNWAGGRTSDDTAIVVVERRDEHNCLCAT